MYKNARSHPMMAIVTYDNTAPMITSRMLTLRIHTSVVIDATERPDKMMMLKLIKPDESIFTFFDCLFVLRMAINARTSSLPDDTELQTVSVSHFTGLAVTLIHTGDLIILDLSAYSAILSQRKNELRGSVALQTCEYGDTPWRGKLLHLHGKDVRSRKSPSDVNQISSVSHNMSGKKTVSGFSQGIHAKAQVPNPIATTCVQAPDCVKGYSVETMCVDDHNVSITYMYNDTQMLSRLSSGEHTILSNIPSIPHLVVTGKELVAIVDSDAMDQERLVSESLAGLEVEMEDELPRFGYLESLNQLEPALKLMLESVRSSLKDKNSQTFGKQVLDAKMEFMYELFLDGLVVLEGATDEAQRKDILQATEKVQHHIEEMRKYVRLMEESVKMGGKEDSVSVGSSTSASLMERRITPGDRDTGLGDMDMTDAADEGSEESSSMYRAWDKMDTMTVIEDGIVKNKMPELQQYFLQRENHELADYSNLCSQGLQLTLKYIKSHDLQKAKQLLTRMGMNVVDQMWHIAMFTLDIDVCMTITECLSEDKSLSEDQIAMVTFLKEVNKLYPSRNFHQQQDLYPHIKDWCKNSDSHQVQRLKSLVQHASEFDLISPCGALGDDKAGDEHRTPECYNEILLAWIQHLDTNTKDLIRLDVQMNNQVSRCMYESSLENSAVVWGDELSSVGEMLKGNHPLPALATLMYSPHKLNQPVLSIATPAKRKVSCALRALEKYSELEPVEHQSYFLFHHFKMKLYESKKLTRETIVQDQTGKELKAMDDNIRTLLLVGGYSESPYVRKRIQQEFPNLQTVIVEDGRLAVMKGAVMMGLKPRNIIQRRARFTYGFEIDLLFKEGEHPEKLKRKRDGLTLCAGVFDKLIKQGQLLQHQQEFSREFYETFKQPERKQLWGCVSLWRSPKRDPRYCYLEEDICVVAGVIRVPPPPGGWPDVVQWVDKLIVGETEFTMKVFIKETVDLLLQCIERGGRSAMELKMALEAAILAGITRDRLNLYLSSLLYKFKSSHLQEHLRYVLVNADLRSLQSEGHSTSSKKRQDAGRDKRLNLYSKIDSATTSDDEDNREFRTDKEMDDGEAGGESV
ncbi:SPTCS-like protein [Mya arenaria]|uniref:SPTCS-like protein n=1 Tax=Mya arenaria TaxID=6604 RepID=A0ABY7DLD8_MYAAR|nr:SPTCS-like protein [Mya arenaria]